MTVAPFGESFWFIPLMELIEGALTLSIIF